MFAARLRNNARFRSLLTRAYLHNSHIRFVKARLNLYWSADLLKALLMTLQTAGRWAHRPARRDQGPISTCATFISRTKLPVEREPFGTIIPRPNLINVCQPQALRLAVYRTLRLAVQTAIPR